MNEINKSLLYQLAKRLNDVIFTGGPPNPISRKNVTASYDPGQWRVRFRVQGAQHTLGFTSNLNTALRFADLLQVYLDQQGFRKFNRAQLNFFEDQAIGDQSHPVAGPLAGEIVNLLFPNGAPAKRPTANRRKTLRDDIQRLIEDVDRLKLTVASLQDKVSVL